MPAGSPPSDDAGASDAASAAGGVEASPELPPESFRPRRWHSGVRGRRRPGRPHRRVQGACGRVRRVRRTTASAPLGPTARRTHNPRCTRPSPTRLTSSRAGAYHGRARRAKAAGGDAALLAVVIAHVAEDRVVRRDTSREAPIRSTGHAQVLERSEPIRRPSRPREPLASPVHELRSRSSPPLFPDERRR